MTVGRNRKNLFAGGIQRAAEKKSFALDQRRLRIAVDDQDFELVLRIEGEIGRIVAGKPVFFEAHLAAVACPAGSDGFESSLRLSPRGGTVSSFCSLFCPSMLSWTSSILDFAVAEIRNRGFDMQRQIDADALTGEADFFDGCR